MNNCQRTVIFLVGVPNGYCIKALLPLSYLVDQEYVES